MQKKILILGGSSLLGSHLIHYLWDKARIVATYHSSPIKLHGVLSIPLDLTNRDAAEKIIHATSPDIVIYAATMTGLNRCHVNTKIADHLNNASPVSISYACEKRGIQFVFLSSCYVFSGETGGYRENENPRPLNTFGGSLTSAEYSIQKNSSNYLIFRLSPVFGRTSSAQKMSLLDYVESNLFHNKVSALDNKIVTNYLSGHILAKMIHVCLKMGINNRILHLASSDTMTRYQFAQTIAKILKKPQELISSRNQEFPVDSTRAQLIDTRYLFGLDVQNAQLLFEHPIPSIEEQLNNYYQLNWLDPDKASTSNKGANFI